MVISEILCSPFIMGILGLEPAPVRHQRIANGFLKPGYARQLVDKLAHFKRADKSFTPFINLVLENFIGGLIDD